MSESEHQPDSPEPLAPRAEGRWRAIESILQGLDGTGRSQAGEKALSRLRAEATAATPTDKPSSHPYVQELMQRYVAGALSPLEVEALQILIRCNNPSRPASQGIRDPQDPPCPVEAQGPSQTTLTPPFQDRSRKTSARVSFRTRNRTKPEPAWSLAATFTLALTTGLLWMWLSFRPAPDVATSGREASRQREEVLKRLEELDREAKALAAQRKAEERSWPLPALSQTLQPDSEREGIQTPVPVPPAEDELAQRKEDAEKCARLLELQRHLLQMELGGARKVRPTDETDEDPEGAIASAEPTAVKPNPASVEAGRVVYVEGTSVKAVLVRAMEGTGHRTDLTAGARLMSGDRIEVAPGGQEAYATLRLQGGTTIDLAARTTLQVVDRNAVRLETGQIYAHVSQPMTTDLDTTYATPFSLQTPAARYLIEEACVEVLASPPVSAQAWTTARVDSGQVHVLSNKGHVLGRKGQEVSASVSAAPNRSARFQTPIWRGRSTIFPGLPLDKGSPLLLSDGCTSTCFSVDYALALAHTGEIDLRGVQIVHGSFDALEASWRAVVQKIARLRTAGLRITPEPVIGATRRLRPPASGRDEDVLPERSPAVDQLLSEARKTTPDRPLVVITSGSLTDLASAWLIDHGMAERTVVITDAKTDMWAHDPWAFRIVLEKYRCVSCHLEVPANTFPSTGLQGTRWASVAARTRTLNKDFSRFACATVPGFVQTVERARFVCGPPENPGRFRFEPDPQGRTWLVKRTAPGRMTREFEATFQTGPGAQ